MATTQTMTVTEALSELKILDKRIDDAIRNGLFCTTATTSTAKISGKSREEAIATMQGDYDRICSLISRNNAIKAALTESNAKTTIDIDGKTYTIAEAIYHKTVGIEMKKKFAKALADQYKNCIATIDRNNGDNLLRKCEDHIIELYGGKDVVSNMSVDTINAAREAFKANNSLELVQGVDVKRKIEELNDEIAAFESKVDAAITIKNATTSITFSFEE